MRILGAILPIAVCAACAQTPDPISIPPYRPDVASVPADAKPRAIEGVEPQLVEYPGLGVQLVANVEEETYCYHERFYCFVDGRWFRADALGGPWDVLSMKYVPVAIYRVRGHLPPELEKEARERNRAAKISLVSFQLVPASRGE
jgi:hypothetical protein